MGKYDGFFINESGLTEEEEEYYEENNIIRHYDVEEEMMKADLEEEKELMYENMGWDEY